MRMQIRVRFECDHALASEQRKPRATQRNCGTREEFLHDGGAANDAEAFKHQYACGQLAWIGPRR